MLLAGADERDLTRLDEYRAVGGYEALAKARAMTPERLIEEMSNANLRGRGGAGFPIGRKASLIPRDSPKPKYVVVNADESEPGAFKDRQVMAEVAERTGRLSAISSDRGNQPSGRLRRRASSPQRASSTPAAPPIAARTRFSANNRRMS